MKNIEGRRHLSRTRVAGLAALLVTACAVACATTTPPGTPMHAAGRLVACIPELRRAIQRSQGATNGSGCVDAFPAADDVLRECTLPLRSELHASVFKGKLRLGVLIDRDRRVTDSCVLFSELGEAPQTLECVARRVASLRASGTETGCVWEITFVLD